MRPKQVKHAQGQCATNMRLNAATAQMACWDHGISGGLPCIGHSITRSGRNRAVETDRVRAAINDWVLLHVSVFKVLSRPLNSLPAGAS